ncbi:MAG: S8 family serine peptidase, partial [Gaiellaceae bacterium]
GYPPNSPILVDAIHKAAADGMLLIAATGNNNLLGRPAYVAYPAAALQPAGGARSYGLAVGASGLDGQPASFSNWGRHLSLLAPGNYAGTCSGVLVAMAPLTDMTGSCYPNWVSSSGGRYAYVPGTSFASPEVAGIAALIWAARPQLKNYQVADIIKQSASHAAGTSWTPTTGCGVLDAGAALALATSRSAAQWAAQSTPDERPCSADGGRPAAWPERDPAPTAQALPARGVWGKALKLQFRVGEDTYQVVPAITVRKNSVAAARLAGGLMPVKPGDAYGLAWRAPRAPTKARLSFCVTLRTTSGKKGAPTCAPISLR